MVVILPSLFALYSLRLFTIILCISIAFYPGSFNGDLIEIVRYSMPSFIVVISYIQQNY